MALSQTSIDRLRQNVIQLMSRTRALEKRGRSLEVLCERQRLELESKDRKIKELESSLTETLLSKSLVEVSGGVRGARVRINGLIRDIDKCISLMNK